MEFKIKNVKVSTTPNLRVTGLINQKSIHYKEEINNEWLPFSYCDKDAEKFLNIVVETVFNKQ